MAQSPELSLITSLHRACVNVPVCGGEAVEMTLHLSLRCAVKRSGKAKEGCFDVGMPTFSWRSAAGGEKKSFPSIPYVIVSVFWFLCENDG